MITLAEIEDARKRIGTSLRRTPTESFAPLRDEIRNHVSLKLENLQVTGSFKPRGALNKILSLPPDARRHGLITASGGNHGLGVAYAGRLLGIPATVFLPESASAVRRERLLRWGATIVVSGRDWDDAYAAATLQAESTGQALIHPFNDPMVCAGQGTVALELLEDCAEQLDAVVVPIGGGGLLAGVAACVKQKNPAIQVIGVEPTEAASMTISLQAGRVVEL